MISDKNLLDKYKAGVTIEGDNTCMIVRTFYYNPSEDTMHIEINPVFDKEISEVEKFYTKRLIKKLKKLL